MFAEDLDVFLADFGVDATLAGAPLRAIIDTDSTVEVDGSLVQGPTALVKGTDAASAARDQAFVAGGVNYKLRAALLEPPDGAFVRLVLVRT